MEDLMIYYLLDYSPHTIFTKVRLDTVGVLVV